MERKARDLCFAGFYGAGKKIEREELHCGDIGVEWSLNVGFGVQESFDLSCDRGGMLQTNFGRCGGVAQGCDLSLNLVRQA